MKVISKKTGRTGTIPDDKFDAGLFDPIGAEAVKPASGFGAPILNFISGLQSGGKPYEAQTKFADPNSYKTFIPPKTAESEAGAAVSGAVLPLMTLLALRKPLAGAGKAAVNPTKYVGGKIETAAARGGTVPNEALESAFGTMGSPNPALYEGLSSAQGKQSLINILRREIATQMRSAGGGLPQPSYEDILNYRKGAYKQGYDKLAPLSEQDLYKRIGKAYSNVLHEGVPETQTLDKVFGTLSGAGQITEGVKNQITRWIIPYLLARQILGGLQNMGQ